MMNSVQREIVKINKAHVVIRKIFAELNERDLYERVVVKANTQL